MKKILFLCLLLSCNLFSADQAANKILIALINSFGQSDSQIVVDDIVCTLDCGGANVNCTNQCGDSPLIIAARHKQNNRALMHVLLTRGANINASGEFGMSPLTWSAHNGNFDAVEFLLQRGARINMPNIFGITPLMWAVISRNREIAKLLLDNHALLDLVDKRGRKAFDIARENKFEEMEQLLDSYVVAVPGAAD